MPVLLCAQSFLNNNPCFSLRLLYHRTHPNWIYHFEANNLNPKLLTQTKTHRLTKLQKANERDSNKVLVIVDSALGCSVLNSELVSSSKN